MDGHRALVIDGSDNVAVALRDIAAGEEVTLSTGAALAAATDVPRGHKVALARIAAGAAVIKYGEPIGLASVEIEPGEWVHTHNIETG